MTNNYFKLTSENHIEDRDLSTVHLMDDFYRSTRAVELKKYTRINMDIISSTQK